MSSKLIPDNHLQYSSQTSYFPIDLDYISIDQICSYDLYLKSGTFYVLYRSANLPFTSLDRDRLKLSKNQTVFIHCANESELYGFYQQNLPSIIKNPAIKQDEKAKTLHFCARGLAKDLFKDIDPKRSLTGARTVVDGTIDFLTTDRENVSRLMLLSRNDPYILSHSVNVMTLTLTLLTAAKIRDPQILKDAGIGAVFHDIGKSKVPAGILDKPGPLTEEEWSAMRLHPELGLEILTRGAGTHRSKAIVIEHHERLNGAGYPRKLAAESLSIPSRAVAICDTYDAMTSTRPYQRAIPPAETFRTLMKNYQSSYDQNLLVELVKALNLK